MRHVVLMIVLMLIAGVVFVNIIHTKQTSPTAAKSAYDEGADRAFMMTDAYVRACLRSEQYSRSECIRLAAGR